MESARTLVTIATYNEIENLPSLVDAVFEQLPDVHLLVIDDNSPDGTGKWCDEQMEQDERLRVVHRAGKLGLGTATIAAMKYTLEHEYDYMLNMDADFSHHPKYLKAMVEGMEPADGEPVDVMIGSRYVAGGGVKDWPLKRQWMSRGVNWYARTMLSLPIRDCSGAYRCYRASRLKQLDFDAIRSRGYSFQEEILWHLKRAGARFAETPIVFADREKGLSKINNREAVAALAILFRLGTKNWIGV